MITLEFLKNLDATVKRDILTYKQKGASTSRVCSRISEDHQRYIRKHSINKTSRQIADVIGHTSNAVNAFARRNGITLKKVRGL